MATRKWRLAFCLLAVVGLLWVGAPVSAQVYWVEAPGFAPPCSGSNPEFGDLDGDGDFDMAYGCALQAYENVGTPQIPEWVPNSDLVDGVVYVSSMTLCFADLDGDGDLDLSAGQLYGNLIYYENLGSPSGPVWERHDEVFEGVHIYGDYFHPELADLDADGDLDLMVYRYNHPIHVVSYRNVGTGSTPLWEEDPSLSAGIDTPHSGRAGAHAGDIDDDGDLDLVVAATSADWIMAFENVAPRRVLCGSRTRICSSV